MSNKLINISDQDLDEKLNQEYQEEMANDLDN